MELEDGEFLADSSLIIETLAQRLGITLDAHLTDTDRARNLLLQRTVEDHLYFCLIQDRWVRDAGFEILRVAYFKDMPAPMRVMLPSMARRGVKKATHTHGIARHDQNTIWRMAVEDIDAIAVTLGGAQFFGGDQPATIDATVYGAIANLLWGPFPGRLQDAVAGHANLVAWAERVHALTFGAAE